MKKPVSTYRLQFQPAFGFDDAIWALPYLKRLGVTHVYASPYLQAAPGSTHGYDVVDHSRVSSELGGQEAFERFVAALDEHELGHILDIVPNHMAIPGRENAWWWDVLKHGRQSAYASFFDIDWRSPDERLHDLVLVPILGDHYAKVLGRGELQLAVSDFGDVVLRYFDNEFPVDDASIPAGLISENSASENIAYDEIAYDELTRINKDLDRLDELIQKQHYRLAYWRVATDELDYRRFFDINTLVALRMDRKEVFDATHGQVLEWLRSGVLDGVRIDHIDGLFDPAQYLRRLRHHGGDEPYVVVEKILERGERLPPAWPVAGTTGYDLLNYVNGVFVEANGEGPLEAVLTEFTGAHESFEETARRGKAYVVDNVLRSDVERLTQLFAGLSEAHRQIRDYTRSQFHAVVRAMLIGFPVYRTYCVADSRQQTQADVESIDEACRKARMIDPDVEVELLRFFCDVLTLRITGEQEGVLSMRFQQATGAVMAKGVEDTAFYRYLRLASLNEVGGDPGHFAVRPDDFHAVCSEMQRLWPNTMIASTTHDTKRSEDVRATLNVLSEVPDKWDEAVKHWARLNERYRRPASSEQPDGEKWPARHDEYLLYQTMVGAFPLSVERAVAYMQKASKEAKLHTSWTEPEAGYDDALRSFIEAAYSNAEFVASLDVFSREIAAYAVQNSLSAVAVKLTMPGVPDIYQGTEMPAYTLVDPDNRQPVNYQELASLLDSLDVQAPSKMLITHKLLCLRRDHPEWFDERSSYDALWSTGAKSAHVLAFRRSHTVTVVPRLTVSLGNEWADTTVGLPDGRWRHVFTDETFQGGEVLLAKLLEGFPVAVLIREGGA